MVRITKLFFVILLFAAALLASDAKGLIKEAEQLLETKERSAVLKSHNYFKSAYLKAIINGDDALAQKALEGIEKSENLLKTNSSPAKSRSKEKNDVGFLPKVQTYRANKNQVILTLSKKIDVSEIETLSLEDKNIKKVIFDIPAIFGSDLKHIKSTFFKDVRIAQYSPDTVRVVMEKGIDFYAQADTLGKKLVLSAFSGEKPAKREKSILPKPEPKKSDTIIRNINKGKIIFIDPGHGGKDGGAVGYKDFTEKDIVLKISNKVAKELKKRGYIVKTSRDTDRFIELENRTKMANRENADLFISIHANSSAGKIDMKGLETYFLSPAKNERATKVASQENQSDLKSMSSASQKTFLSFLNREKVIASNKLAIDLQKNILSNLKKKYSGVVGNGVREGPFWVLVGAQMPAVLLEIGYITSPLEAKRLMTARYQNIIAKGIADGVDSYFYHN